MTAPLKDMEEILQDKLEEATAQEEKAVEAFDTAFHNWELGKAVKRIELEEKYGRGGEGRSESYISAKLKVAEAGELAPLKDAYIAARKEKRKAEAYASICFAKIQTNKSRNYTRRI